MLKYYNAEINESKVFTVQEDNNTIGKIYWNKEHFEIAGEYPIAICVNDEVLFFGKSIGYLKNKTEIN